MIHLITSSHNMCVAASLAMAFDKPLDEVIVELGFDRLEYPFEPPFELRPKVPSMDIIVDWAYTAMGVAMVPFERNPVCSPHENCKPVPVWSSGENMFRQQLNYGPGVIECLTLRGLGHMVAWDGLSVFDPRGYYYKFEDMGAYDLEATRFWLCT